MRLTDGWLLWERLYVSIFAILIKTYFDEVLIAKEIMLNNAPYLAVSGIFLNTHKITRPCN
jgi:hypothetical protein